MAPASPFRKANVLAVDDKRANLLAIEAVLAATCNVVYAESGREAIELVSADGNFDVVLMDVQMPVMDGFETAARIKQLPAGRELPIIFITAVFSEDPYIKRGYEVGGVDYFSKPFDPAILKQKVAIYASFRQRADLLREREQRLLQLEAALELGRDLSSQLAHQHIGVLLADAAGGITQLTDEATAVLCSSCVAGEAWGRLMEWWSGDGAALKGEGSPLDRALHHGETVHNRALTLRCVDRALKSLLCSASPLRDRNGRVHGAVLLIHDLADSRKIETELEQAVTSLVEAGTPP